MNARDPHVDELRALRTAVEQFTLLCNNVPVAIAYFERASYLCRYANRGYAEMFGHTEASVIGLKVAQVIGSMAADAIQPHIDRAMGGEQGVRYERQLPDSGAGARSIEVHLLPHLGGDGAAVGAFVLIGDISRHRQAERALRESEERLAKFMHASAEGIVFHKGGIITDVNPPLLDLLGYTLAEMMGRPTLDFVAPEHRQRVAEVIAAGHEIGYDSAALHRDGSVLPVEFIVRTMMFQGERLRMTIVRDIRDRIDAQAAIHHMAHHDALTGLPNRAAFTRRAEVLMAQAAAGAQVLALLFIDLDQFKRINDSLGHSAGDTSLAANGGRTHHRHPARGRPGGAIRRR